MQKLDPYLNVDPGTMNPYQHGEVYVTEDGGETDLDIGHYERFIDESLNKYCNVTAGKVYYTVINNERNGVYAGSTIQMIPHITNMIKEKIRLNATTNEADVAIVEIGGTVGDYESLPFLEAIRQFAVEEGQANCMYIHVGLVPCITPSNELKTKPVWSLKGKIWNHTEEMRAVAEKIDSRLPEWARKCWRWRIFMLRVIIDSELAGNRDEPNKATEAAMNELVEIYGIDPSLASRRVSPFTDKWLRTHVKEAYKLNMKSLGVD